MITLRYFTKSDFQQLIKWVYSEELLLQIAGGAFTYPLTPRQLKAYIKGANEEGSSSYIFTALENGTGRMVGHIAIGRIDYENGSGRIAKVLIGDPDGRKQGLGTSMVEEVLKFGFEQLGLHRISLGVFHSNLTALRVYERIGFRQEGVLRDIKKVGENYWSLIEMSMLEHEWRERTNLIETKGIIR